MPNKENPEECEVIAGLANLIRQLSRSVEEIQMDGIRDSTRTPVLAVAIPQSMMLTSQALFLFSSILDDLEPVPGRMRQNLEHDYVLQQAVAERLMIAVYKKTGRKLEAHQRLHDCAIRSRKEQLPFREAFRQEPKLGPMLDEQELDELFDLSTYTGNAVHRTEKIVALLQARS
jgi:adenylosuccinate lyase